MRHSGAACAAGFDVQVLDVHFVVVCGFRSSNGMLAVFGVLVESYFHSFYSDFKDLRKVVVGCCYMISNLTGLQGVENVQGEE